MKVFISWSGNLSHSLALQLKDWLPLVLPFTKPYVSSEDVDKGARWSTDIAGELEAAAFGILCVTPVNVGEPWINFEAGALSRSLDKSRVCPLLAGLRPAEIDRRSPLLQFQAAVFEKNDTWNLVQTIQKAANEDNPYTAKQFDVWWPSLEREVQGLMKRVGQAPTVQTQQGKPRVEAMLDELLELARGEQRERAAAHYTFETLTKMRSLAAGERELANQQAYDLEQETRALLEH